MDRYSPTIQTPQTEGELNASLYIERITWMTAKTNNEWKIHRQAMCNLNLLLDTMLEMELVKV